VTLKLSLARVAPGIGNAGIVTRPVCGKTVIAAAYGPWRAEIDAIGGSVEQIADGWRADGRSGRRGEGRFRPAKDDRRRVLLSGWQSTAAAVEKWCELLPITPLLENEAQNGSATSKRSRSVRQ